MNNIVHANIRTWWLLFNLNNTTRKLAKGITKCIRKGICPIGNTLFMI